MCIDVLEIWFEIANGQILSAFDRVICLPHDSGRILSFQVFIYFHIYSGDVRLCLLADNSHKHSSLMFSFFLKIIIEFHLFLNF